MELAGRSTRGTGAGAAPGPSQPLQGDRLGPSARLNNDKVDAATLAQLLRDSPSAASRPPTLAPFSSPAHRPPRPARPSSPPHPRCSSPGWVLRRPLPGPQCCFRPSSASFRETSTSPAGAARRRSSRPCPTSGSSLVRSTSDCGLMLWDYAEPWSRSRPSRSPCSSSLQRCYASAALATQVAAAMSGTTRRHAGLLRADRSAPRRRRPLDGKPVPGHRLQPQRLLTGRAGSLAPSEADSCRQPPGGRLVG